MTTMDKMVTMKTTTSGNGLPRYFGGVASAACLSVLQAQPTEVPRRAIVRRPWMADGSPREVRHWE